ncbi:MAG: AarF/ABC1/UbiB kinase family protein, partial [Pseudomonadota bacterium]
ASRIARLTRLGAMTAGVAGNMAIGGIAELGQGRRPTARNLLLNPANVNRITNQLAQMRGAAMKVGQMMSMDAGEALPPELADILARLRADAHFMPPSQLKKVLNNNWDKGWLKAFKRFDVHPIAAASIGQVHRAELKDGRDMAIKIQYPGIARSIDSDVANVGALIKVSGLLPPGFDMAPYLEEACKQLHEETDYQREGGCLAEFRTLLDGDARFVVPERYEDWTTTGILAMSFVAGDPIEAAAQAPQTTRDQIAHRLIDLVLTELFTFGLMQTDPNFANYRYKAETAQIVLLDFGATRAIDPEIIGQYRRLLRAGLDNETARVTDIAAEIGFFAPDTPEPQRRQIIGMIETVFEEVRTAPEFDFGRTTLPARMQAAGMELAEQGFVPPPLPMDLLYLQRKFSGMFLLAARLRARVRVSDLLEAHLTRAGETAAATEPRAEPPAAQG